jgi:hypothetical protein
MKQYQTENSEYRGVEDKLATLAFRTVEIPDFELLMNKVRVPAVESPYAKVGYFSNIQTKFFAAIMSVPAFALALAFFVYNMPSGESVYLASNDLQSMEQANIKIMNNIDALANVPNLYEGNN